MLQGLKKFINRVLGTAPAPLPLNKRIEPTLPPAPPRAGISPSRVATPLMRAVDDAPSTPAADNGAATVAAVAGALFVAHAVQESSASQDCAAPTVDAAPAADTSGSAPSCE